MGSHTWFYKKVKKEPSYDEVKEKVIKNYQSAIKIFRKFLNGTLPKKKMWYIDVYNINKETAAERIAVFERSIRMINKNLCKIAVYNKYNYKGKITYYIDGKGLYVAVDDTHDIFRYGYTDTILCSLSDTLKFIEDNDSDIGYNYDKETTILKLKKFWEKYPDGMIDFG